MSNFSRRDFLKGSSLCALGSATGFAANLASFNAYAADTTGYKALVCLFFFGGMDCHDTVLPYDIASYNSMASIRQSLFGQYAGAQGGNTRAHDRLLALNALNQSDHGGLEFALPEQLAPIHELFSMEKAAIVGNVGPLIEPMNREQFRSGSVRRPARLFSHNDQQSTWMASAPEGAQLGWGGRMADIMLAANANSRASFTSVSAAGNSVFLSGQNARQIQVSTSGARSINGINSSSQYGSQLFPGLWADQMMDASNSLTNFFERDTAAVTRRAVEANRDLASALDSAPPLTTAFPDSGLGRELSIVARMIGVRDQLGVNRQIYFVSMGGFDTHSGQAGKLPGLHANIASSVRAFYDATVELGISDSVTLFTASDFGRTLTENGDGTDHGWGAHHFVVGGAVRGRRLLGQMPETALKHDLDSNNGRLIPTTSVDQYAAGLGRWFGLSDSEIIEAMPAAANFSPFGVDLFTSSGST